MDITMGSKWQGKNNEGEVEIEWVNHSRVHYFYLNGPKDVHDVSVSVFLEYFEPAINRPTHERTLGGQHWKPESLFMDGTKGHHYQAGNESSPEKITYYNPSQGRKDDSSKRRYSLLPAGTVNSVVDVLEFGAIKYAPDNWQVVPNARTRYYDAAMRHLDAWFNGETKDSETGLPHLAHAICCLMFLMWFDNKGDK